MITLIKQYAEYNRWANQKMSDWLCSKDQALMDIEIKSSFPTINKTLSHIWVAEHVWMCRIENLKWDNLATRHEGQSMEQIIEDLLWASQWYIDKLKGVSETDLIKLINYKLLSGDTGESSLLHIFHHVMNHSTYHRGQLVTMMRMLGLEEIPAMDLIVFQRLNA